MTLRLDCYKRNFELEGLKHQLKGKRIALREDPLAALGFDEYGNPIPKDEDAYDPEGVNNDDE